MGHSDPLDLSKPTSFTNSNKMYRVVLDLEALTLAGRQTQVVKLFVFNVEYSMAFTTHQMMVPLDHAVEARARTRMMQSPNHFQLHECFQSPIHGSPRQIGNASSDRLVYLIGRRMIVPFQDDLQSRPTLYRQRQPSLTAQSFELLYPLLDARKNHTCK
jgi:hypothetical protein